MLQRLHLFKAAVAWQMKHSNPNIVAVYNVAPPDDDDVEREMVWKIEMGVWNELNCPLLLTTTSEKKLRMTCESLRLTFCSSRLCYEGINDFAPLYPIRDWEEWGVSKNYQYMVVVKPPENNIRGPAKGSFPFAKTFQDFHKPIKKSSKVFFSPNFCSLCHSNSALVVCKRCKLIFYCSEAHQKEDSTQHRDFCKIILGMVVKDRVTSIFENLKNTDSETWLTAKIDLMRTVKNQIGRDLEEFEKQIFLFPKTCFICHESDLSRLTNCECGIILCEIHMKNSKHTEICSDYSTAIKFKMLEKAPSVKAVVKEELFNRSDDNLPASIESFINLYLKVNDSSSFGIPNFDKILISDALSMPLTALYALQKLKLSSKKNLNVHILGAIHREVVEEGFWIILNWFRGLKKLELTFFDSDISTKSLNYTTDLLFHDHSFFGEKGFEVATHMARYDNYCRLGSIEKPHFIIGYNLNVHEIDYGFSDCSWEDIILTVKKMNVPFVMTSGSEERARKDHRKLSSFLGKTVEFFSSAENPFASLLPERDFESEGLSYQNKFITIYNDLNKNLIDKFPPLANIEFDKKFNFSSNFANLSFGTTNAQSPIFKVELETDRKEVGVVENSEVKIEGSILETDRLKLETENSKLERNSPEFFIENCKIELKKTETEIVNEKEDFRTESSRSNEELLKENFLLKKINRLLMENVRLKEENERIRNENLKIKVDSEKLTAENITIKDIRQQVQESIQLALNDRK
ncbi:uncharacterized protein LOC117173954 [Belonocnema kinseyi]|uniref:uncharacterized protein LOC117173954 n=1 Tax=Belonocnema kinseyi TaxID=2817044 RepID=UPI00143D5CDE|nr:uncharacterized protein LOC117173954 [Belonocnema kinseyi]